jgi:hypothetical protein
MDESNKQLVGEVHAPLAAAPGRGQIIDHEYVRNGVAEIFLEVEPLSGRRHVAITEQRTRKNWAMFIKGMLDERYPPRQCVIAVNWFSSIEWLDCSRTGQRAKVAWRFFRHCRRENAPSRLWPLISVSARLRTP